MADETSTSTKKPEIIKKSQGILHKAKKALVILSVIAGIVLVFGFGSHRIYTIVSRPSTTAAQTAKVAITPLRPTAVQQYRPEDCTEQRRCIIELKVGVWTPVSPPTNYRVEQRQLLGTEILVEVAGKQFTGYGDPNRYMDLPTIEGIVRYSPKGRNQPIQIFFTPIINQ
mgnify:CR=1 FL=1